MTTVSFQHPLPYPMATPGLSDNDNGSSHTPANPLQPPFIAHQCTWQEVFSFFSLHPYQYVMTMAGTCLP